MMPALAQARNRGPSSYSLLCKPAFIGLRAIYLALQSIGTAATVIVPQNFLRCYLFLSHNSY